MQDVLTLRKMSLVVTTRCNLKCRLCDEFIPENKPFADMTPLEARRILSALFDVVDFIELLHLAGGGEPFLSPHLPELIDIASEYSNSFDKLMIFTNSTIPMSEELFRALKRHRDIVVVHASNYGIAPKNSKKLYERLLSHDISLREIKYYGKEQEYGGWVDFGPWENRNRSPEENARVFKNCGVTHYMNGNWRTRDGTVHWCQRSQRGRELGLLHDCPDDYIDLLCDDSREEKRDAFRRVMTKSSISACDCCSGEHGTQDKNKRFPAGEQMR